MKCSRCQQHNPPEASYCLKCGSPADGAAADRRSYAELSREVDRLRHAVTESAEQQTATAETLRIISRFPTDVQPTFEAIAAAATTLCEAENAGVFLFDGTLIRFVAHHGWTAEDLAAIERLFPRPLDRRGVTGRAILDRAVAHVPDIANDPEYQDAPIVDAGFRAILSVPMLRDGEPIGTINVTRRTPVAFTDAQIALLQTFADQAVIAIENVRLFTELQQKNEALLRAHAQVTEALEQQTATAEILRVISSSPTGVQPVLDAVAQNAARVCGASDALILRLEDGTVRHAAHFGDVPLLLPPVRPLTNRTISDRAMLEGRTIHVEDVLDPAILAEYPDIAAITGQAPWRTHLSVPLLREGTAIGAISIRRMEIRPFTEKQIALLQTFADQAVIAIENVRLFNEVEESNRDLREALEQKTASAEILRVISQSQTDVQPVFDTIIRSAVRLSGAAWAIVTRVDAELIHLVAHHNLSAEELARFRRIWPHPVASRGPTSRVVRTGELFRVVDIEVEDCGLSEQALADFRARGIRSMLVVPMFRDGRVAGTINLTHQAVGAFSDAHVELVKTFASQAVIAIENVRLFTELQARNNEIEEKSRQLEVASQHKSEFLANMSHELRTPLNAVIGFSEVLRDRMFGDLNDKQEEYLNDIHTSGQHLLSLINDILDLSKIEAGRMELELTDFHLPATLDNALTLVRERAGRRSIALHAAIDDRIEYVRADERKIKQVMLNLLSNAIKFTLEGGQIDVRAVLRDGIVEVSVSDTGVGIAPEDEEVIFEEFRQVGTASKKVEGTGLGLALSRKFIELHGGRIWVESRVGVGSTFRFTIPVRRGEEEQ